MNHVTYIDTLKEAAGSSGVFIQSCRLLEDLSDGVSSILVDCYGDQIVLDQDNRAEVKVNTSLIDRKDFGFYFQI